MDLHSNNPRPQLDVSSKKKKKFVFAVKSSHEILNLVGYQILVNEN